MPSTPTDALLDVNVLIASVFADHVRHAAARRFVQGLQRFLTSPTTQEDFFDSLPARGKTSAEEQPPRLTMAAAHLKLRDLTEIAGHTFLSDDAAFTELRPQSLMGHRQWTDAYLLHLARKHGVVMASLDSRMAILDDPERPALFLLPLTAGAET